MKRKSLTLNHKEKIINLFSVVNNCLDLSDKSEDQIVKAPLDILKNLNISFGEAKSLIQFANENVGVSHKKVEVELCWINVLNESLEFEDNQTLFICGEITTPVSGIYMGDEKDFLILEIINWKLYEKNLLSFLEINKFKLSTDNIKKIESAESIFIINEDRKEISRKDNKKFKHEFRKIHGKNKRFEYIIKIYNIPQISGSKLAGVGNLQNLSKELREINNTLKDKLKLSEDFILNDNNTGYKINDKYHIEFT